MVDIPLSPEQKLRARRDLAIETGAYFNENTERLAIDMANGKRVLGPVTGREPEIILEDPRRTTIWDSLDANSADAIAEAEAIVTPPIGGPTPTVSTDPVLAARLDELEEENRRKAAQIRELMGQSTSFRLEGHAEAKPAAAGGNYVMEGTPNELWTALQLRQYAAERGIEVPPRMQKKSDMIEHIFAVEQERKEMVEEPLNAPLPPDMLESGEEQPGNIWTFPSGVSGDTETGAFSYSSDKPAPDDEESVFE